MRLASIPDLKSTQFSYESVNMERAGKGPWLVLMNHSSFLDFEIASKILWPKRFNIVATSDGFVGKEWLMRSLGCIPTRKFLPDPTLIKDIKYALDTNHTNVLMYPEASYSFDGTTTALPPKFSRLFKLLGVPVVMITTYGSFTRDPLYNNLQNRKVKVSAKVECLLTPEEIRSSSVEEMDEIMRKAFDLDYFKWQKDNAVRTPETFRADGLNRILFRCADCETEGAMEASGTTVTCKACGSRIEMDEYGQLSSKRFQHIPDWYRWQRELICKHVRSGNYSLDTKVRIGMMVDYESIYFVGEGTLRHDSNGFVLDGCNGELHFEQGPKTCYSVYSDYFWYEIGDVICIGNGDALYYCFPETKDIVARTRIAVEEIFKHQSSILSNNN